MMGETATMVWYGMAWYGHDHGDERDGTERDGMADGLLGEEVGVGVGVGSFISGF